MAKNKFNTGRPVAKGDVANMAVRNVLSEISKKLLNTVTSDYLLAAAAFFGYKCPYTGRDIKQEILSFNTTNLALDHIVPENKESLGLNIEGNTILVDKIANSVKSDKSVEDFLLKDKFFANVPLADRQARLQKIKDFQVKYAYDQSKINQVVGNSLKYFYEEIKNKLDIFSNDLIKKINKKCFKVNSELAGFIAYLHTKIKPNSVNRYAKAIKDVVVIETLKVKDLDNKNKLLGLIKEYSKGGNKYNPNDKGHIVAVLKKYADYKKINLKKTTINRTKISKVTITQTHIDFKRFLESKISKNSAQNYYGRLMILLSLEGLELFDLTNQKVLDRLIKEYGKNGCKKSCDTSGAMIAALKKFNEFNASMQLVP